jgi:hypothetical protein
MPFTSQEQEKDDIDGERDTERQDMSATHSSHSHSNTHMPPLTHNWSKHNPDKNPTHRGRALGARGLQYTPEGVDVISLTSPCSNCRRHERVRCVGVTERMSCEACVLAQARNICGVGLWGRSLASQQEVSFTVCTLGSAYTNLVTIQTRTTSTTVND